MPLQNNVNTRIFGQSGGFNIPNVSYPSVKAFNLASGDNNIYTCPSNKRALITQLYFLNKDLITDINVFCKVNISGTDYRLTSTNTIFTPLLQSQYICFVLEPNEIFKINTNAVNISAFVNIIEYDAQYPLYSSRLTSFVVGDNTLYQCPVGKKGIPITGKFNPTGANSTFGSTSMTYTNTGSATVTLYNVPNGQPVNSDYQSNAPAAGVIGNIQQVFEAGDRLIINTSSSASTQFAYFNVQEFDV